MHGETAIHALCICQTMMSSQGHPSKQTLAGPPGKPFISQCHSPLTSAVGRDWRKTCVSRSRGDACCLGGARRDRTDDLMLAKHALYQLSYGPFVSKTPLGAVRRSDV